jgi:PAS domain S-box-containing protein
VGVGAAVLGAWAAGLREHRRSRTQSDRYESLLLALSEIGEGMIVLEGERCVFANTAFERLSGYTFSELAALESVFDLLPPAERPAARERSRRRLDAGLIEREYGVTLRRRDGRHVRLEVGGVPLAVAGRRQLMVVARDVTARERLLQRTALLAEAGRLFDAEPDEARRLAGVSRLVVRALADVCVIALADAAGSAHRAAAAARDREPSQAELETAEAMMAAVLRDGRGRVLPAPGHDGAVAVVVPMQARGRVHGALCACCTALGDAEEPDVLDVFEELGRRAALALDNTRLYDELLRVSRSLQQSLLPPALVRVPGVELAARYISAADGLVGGDFYDAFATEDGNWALVVGDVCGKGAEAAAVTALARHTLRAAALRTSCPDEVLAALNEAILRAQLDYRFCTVAYTRVAPLASGEIQVTVATGGHPLPIIVRADGRVASLGRPGCLLGIMRAPRIEQAVTTLSPGDMLVLYTDGVIEASPADDAFGPGRLAALLTGCAGHDAPSVAAAIESEVLRVQHGRVRDDVAVLVARVPVRDRFPARPPGVAALA